MIVYSGIEWDYNTLEGIAYDSDTLLEPYSTWFVQITGAVSSEKETFNLIGDTEAYYSIYSQKENLIKLKDYYSKNVGYKDSDTFTVSDGYLHSIKKISEENLSITESDIRKLSRKNKESKFYMLDNALYKYKAEGDEDWTVVELFEYSGSTTLYDLEINNSAWSEDDFDKWCSDNCPINYSGLRPLIPGEYEYTNAYVGFRLSLSPTVGRFGVAHSTLYVDVEDTVEKGTVETQGGSLVQVNFSKRFYTTPQIMTSLNYTLESAYIDVQNVSRDGFEFGIKSTTTGNYVQGSINWLADGY